MAACNSCGRQLKEQRGLRFCPFCGSGLDAGSGETIILARTEPAVVERPAGGGPGGEPAQAPEPLPAAFGRYRVVRELGRGAMAVVYLARDDSIGRDVAVKALNSQPGLSAEQRRERAGRFQREARAAGTLQHPNIVVVYDYGEESGRPFIAMEYLRGATLPALMSEGPCSVQQATSMIEQVLRGLDCAHGHEVVHRDIKPDNIFFFSDGRVKITDFGIARVTASCDLTAAGQVLGTPRYMSPEQVKGETVGPPSDIFSTGVVLYELLTGKPAFDGESPTTVMYRVVHEEPRPLHLVNPAVPSALGAVIVKATAKLPAERYRTASEMLADLRAAAAGGHPAQPPGATVMLSGPGSQMRCGSCGFAIPPGGVFCPECGSGAAAHGQGGPAAQGHRPGATPAGVESRVFCPECGLRLPQGAVFCPECGSRIP